MDLLVSGSKIHHRGDETWRHSGPGREIKLDREGKPGKGNKITL